ncbi:CBS domain-containing protein [Aeromicrobium sp.]|nr:CBS domain-containing protein [Candidatus Saccharibacteria bacterium]
MISLVFGLLAAVVALSFLSLLKTYRHIPPREVKRMARAGDKTAEVMYKPIAYGASLPVVLWLVIGIALSTSLVLLTNALPLWIAIVVVALIIWAGFAWIPSTDLSNIGVWLAKRLASPLAWLLERLNPKLARIANFIHSHQPISIHTGLYQKSDLAELLQAQKDQPDNRIAAGEIELLTNALSFGDKVVADVLIPKRVVDVVNVTDAIGPVLTDELHKSGHSRFPVYEDKHDNIVGVLFLKDLIMNKQTGIVRGVMKSNLNYVHEDFTLYQTLEAFIKTKHHLFLVVNQFEEFVGIITIEDVIEQMTGKVIMDEFDTYDDLRAVAATAAKKEHAKHSKPTLEPTPEAQEVVK